MNSKKTPTASSTPTATNSTSGLLAAYSFNQSTGNTLPDDSGNNHPGILVNNPTWTAGKYGNAINFDGINDYVTIGDLDLTGSFTISFWATADNLGNGCHGSAVMKRHDYGLEVCNGLMHGQAGTGSGGFDSTLVYTIPQSGVWNYYALTYDGTTARLYVNGNLINSVAKSHASNNNPLMIGTWDTGSEFYDGLIDEVRIYTRVLSQSEMQSDMNTPIGGTPPPTATPTSIASRIPTPAVTASPTATIPQGGTVAYPLKARGNGRYLVDQNNVPFLIVGDSPQGLMAIFPADQQTYLSSRQAAGINALWHRSQVKHFNNLSRWLFATFRVNFAT